MNNKYFSVNPYPYKKDYQSRVAEDSIFLQNFFNKSEDEIRLHSEAYMNNESGLRSFLLIVRNYNYLKNYELSNEATSLAIAIMIFAIDALMVHLEKVPSKRKKSKSKGIRTNNKNKPDIHCYRLQAFFRNCIDREQKAILLNSFVFSAKSYSSIPIGQSINRHMMYKPMIMDMGSHYKSEWCTADSSLQNIHCNCLNWLKNKPNTKIDLYLNRLCVHLYKMRCAIVHDGLAPLFVHNEKKPLEATNWGISLSDVYFNNKNARHYRYESAISRSMIEDIFKQSLWTAYLYGYPNK